MKSYLNVIGQKQRDLFLFQRSISQDRRTGPPVPWGWFLKRSVRTFRLFETFGNGDIDFQKCFYYENYQGVINNPYYQTDLMYKEKRIVLFPSKRRFY